MPYISEGKKGRNPENLLPEMLVGMEERRRERCCAGNMLRE
jgi:hypothetical protein